MEQTKNAQIAASFSLYEGDCERLVKLIEDARTLALVRGEKFYGISVDVDDLGFLKVYAAGLETLEL